MHWAVLAAATGQGDTTAFTLAFLRQQPCAWNKEKKKRER